MHLLGFKNLKKVEGNISVLFKGRECHNAGELLLVDHANNRVDSIFEDTTESKMTREIDAIMAD